MAQRRVAVWERLSCACGDAKMRERKEERSKTLLDVVVGREGEAEGGRRGLTARWELVVSESI